MKLQYEKLAKFRPDLHEKLKECSLYFTRSDRFRTECSNVVMSDKKFLYDHTTIFSNIKYENSFFIKSKCAFRQLHNITIKALSLNGYFEWLKSSPYYDNLVNKCNILQEVCIEYEGVLHTQDIFGLEDKYVIYFYFDLNKDIASQEQNFN